MKSAIDLEGTSYKGAHHIEHSALMGYDSGGKNVGVELVREVFVVC